MAVLRQMDILYQRETEMLKLIFFLGGFRKKDYLCTCNSERKQQLKFHNNLKNNKK